jgi:putative ABC transport system permease protein
MQIYVPNTQMAESDVIMVVRTSIAPASVGASVRREIAAVDPQQPVTGMATMEEIVSASVVQQRFSVLLFTLFAAIALLLAAVGIFGVISSIVTQRTHEIGIRMALGAKKRDVLQLVILRGLQPALLGVVLGVAAALGLTRFLASMLFQVTPTDPGTLLLVTGALALVAALACYFPARRALRVDPMLVLRNQ